MTRSYVQSYGQSYGQSYRQSYGQSYVRPTITEPQLSESQPEPHLFTSTFFPPRPSHIRGRAAELATLSAALRPARARPTVLLGGGGSGKSLLACALGHRLRRWMPGGIHWFRVGAWDHRTLFEMLALRFRTDRETLIPGLRAHLQQRGRCLIVLDNHENDRALARFLEALRGVPVTWLLTARRCLLAGVSLFPVVAPLHTSARQAFPRVAPLTPLLRWNPLALAISDAIVGAGGASVAELRDWLLARGVERVSVMQDEDDVVEVRLLVDWAWRRLDAAARRMMAVLAHVQGDHVDAVSLHRLARVAYTPRGALSRLRQWELVQEPLADRFALHAVVRRAVADRARFAPSRYFEHYLRLLERDPDRLSLEQSHLFAAMDYAHDVSDMRGMLRVERLLRRL